MAILKKTPSGKSLPMVGDKVVIIKDGKPDATGKNLEVLSRYYLKYRKGGANYVQIVRGRKLVDGTGLMFVKYDNGATSNVRFADYIVMKRWIDTKVKRSDWQPG